MSPKFASDFSSDMRGATSARVEALGAAASNRPARPLVESFTDEAGRARHALAHLSDRQLGLAVAAVMFAISAWPLALVEVPPYQDLPNHLAAIEVMRHPDLYPEFVFNGWLKTNTALFAWLYFVGKVVGLKLAAKLFTLLVLGLMSFTLPRFVLELTSDRRKMVISCLFAWPFVHNWFVSMGMLDFAMAVPLAMSMIIAMHKHERAPSWKSAAAIVGLGLLTWTTHVFCLLVVLLLAVIHVAVQRTRGERIALGKRLGAALALPALLAIVSVAVQATEPVGPMTGYQRLDKLLPLWELAYNMWAEWFWSFTKLTIATFVPVFGLVYYGVRNRRAQVPYFSTAAVLVLVLLYVFGPYSATNWFHVNSRLIPFIWLYAVLRVPTRLPRRVGLVLALAAVLSSAGLAADFVRLDKERIAFTAGIPAVPQHARLLPLIFKAKHTSENTQNLLHAWGYYVVEKETSAPLLFAHSRSFPVMYAEPPPHRFNHLVLESFAPSMRTPDWLCGSWHTGGVVIDNCERNYHERWAEFWNAAEPRYDHVLMWDAAPEAIAEVPAYYELVFQRDRLRIFARKGGDAMSHADIDHEVQQLRATQ